MRLVPFFAAAVWADPRHKETRLSPKTDWLTDRLMRKELCVWFSIWLVSTSSQDLRDWEVWGTVILLLTQRERGRGRVSLWGGGLLVRRGRHCRPPFAWSSLSTPDFHASIEIKSAVSACSHRFLFRAKRKKIGGTLAPSDSSQKERETLQFALCYIKPFPRTLAFWAEVFPTPKSPWFYQAV